MKIARKNAQSRNSHQIDVLEQRRLLSAAISFASHTDFMAGGDPVAIVAADFNNDGNMDIAVADTSPNQISIFYGNGQGGFSAGPILAVSGTPTSLIAGEFNSNNTYPDLAVGCSPGGVNTGTTVTVFVNNAGVFELGQTTTVFTGATANEPIALASGDFNGDGFLDIAATEFSNNSIAILLGTGNGTFQTPVPYSVDNNPTSIVAADFNGDGKLDLAVADTDTITNSDMSTSSVSAVTFLSGAGDGTFTVASRQQLDTTAADVLATADLNNDNKPDLIVASADSSSDVFLNNGKFQFTESATFALAGPDNSIAAGDFNGDNDTDLIYSSGGPESTSVNEVSIAAGAGDGTISNFSDAPTGQEPVAVVAADFNRDGKPDLAVADESGGQISILLNTTAVTILKPTQITLQDDSSTAPFGQQVDFSAIVSTSGSGFDTGTPDGTVEFFVNNKPAAMETLDNTGTAVFSTATLAVGNEVIYAQYLGDSTFARSTSSSVDQTITPTSGHGPDLAGSFIASTVPSIIIPGQKINVKIRVTNQGNTTAAGTITNDVFLSLDNTLDPGDIFVPLTGPLAQPKVNLKPGASITLSGTLVIPTDAPTSNYILLADLNDTQTLLESDYSNDVVVSPSMSDDEDDFGLINGHSTALTLPDADGTIVTYKLNGPGIGTVNIGDDGIDVSLTDTTPASALTITGTGGNGFADLNSISSDGPLASIQGPKVNLASTLTLSGSARKIILNDFGTATSPVNTMTLGPGAATSITLVAAVNTDLDASSGINSLTVGSFGSVDTSNSTFNLPVSDIGAPWIGSLSCKGEFDSVMNLSGSNAPHGMALRQATLSNTQGLFWQITGSVGKIAVVTTPQTAVAVSVDASGSIGSFVDNGDFGGQISAANFGSITIDGDLDGTILAGADLQSQTFNAGAIKSLQVTGSASGALVAAGLNDFAIPISDAQSLLPGGQIKSISIDGPVDSTSKFLADLLPPKVQIGGTTVTPAADPRFQI